MLDNSLTLNEAALNGAYQVISRCLGLSVGQELLVFADETTVNVATVLSEAATKLGVLNTIILVPIAQQRRTPRELPKDADMSALTAGAGKWAHAILTCVNSAPDCLPFRLRIIETEWGIRTKIGHMPGASLDILTLANVNFDRLIEDCHKLEVAMAHGRTLELLSYSTEGTLHQLKTDIGGWERLPVASDGVIADGAWGNVPSGETYIAPIEGSAEGSVVINGSIADRVITPGEEIVLFFEGGKLARIDPPDNSVARWLYDTQINPATVKGDENWSCLAEIGVGVNPAVVELTGNMLFDEKAAQTAHVAIGANTFMGGVVDSVIHCDMVIRRPTILIDGLPVLDRGALQLEVEHWLPDYRTLPLTNSPALLAEAVRRSGIEVQRSPEGRLRRILQSEPGRRSSCSVGKEESSRLAAQLYDALPVNGHWMSVDALFASSQIPVDTARRVLNIMFDYQIIEVRAHL